MCRVNGSRIARGPLMLAIGSDAVLCPACLRGVALSRQLSIGEFWRQLWLTAIRILEQKQRLVASPECPKRQYRIYSDNAPRGLAPLLPNQDDRRPRRPGRLDDQIGGLAGRHSPHPEHGGGEVDALDPPSADLAGEHRAKAIPPKPNGLMAGLCQSKLSLAVT